MGQKILTHLFKGKLISIFIGDKIINDFPFKNCIFENKDQKFGT